MEKRKSQIYKFLVFIRFLAKSSLVFIGQKMKKGKKKGNNLWIQRALRNIEFKKTDISSVAEHFWSKTRDFGKPF